jgi:hypothetical protein
MAKGKLNPRSLVRSRLLQVAVLATVVYALCGFFLIPYLVRHTVPKTASEKFNLEARLGGVHVNPFTLTLEANDFRLRDARGVPLGGFDRFFVDFQLSSLLRWALTFRSVAIDAPAVHLIVAPDGRLNLPALESGASDRPPQKNAAGPVRLLLHNIRVSNGVIDIIDRRQSTPATVRLRPLNFALKEISTLPERKGPYTLTATTPRGESLKWQGNMTLSPLRSAGKLAFSNIRVASLWEFFRDSVNLSAPGGRIDLNTSYALELGGSEPQLTLENLVFRLSDVTLQLRDEDQPFFSLDALELDPVTVRLADRSVAVGALRVGGAAARVAVDSEGRLNLERIARPGGVDNGSPAAPRSNRSENTRKRPWRVNIATISLSTVALDYADDSRRPALRSRIGNAGARFRLKAVAAPQGAEIRLEDLTARIADLTAATPDSAEPIVYLRNLDLSGGAFDSEQRKLSFTRVGLNGGNLQIVRQADSSFNLLQLLRPPKTGKLKRQAETAEKSAPPLRFESDTMEIRELMASFSDRTVRADGSIMDAGPVYLRVTGFDGRTPSDFELTIPVQQGGTISADGRFDPDQRTLISDTRIRNLSLVPFQPYLDARMKLKLRSGAFTTAGRLAVGQNVTFDGGVRITRVRVTETDSAEPFLSWKVLDAPRLKLQTAPNRLEIEEVKLVQPFNKLIIYADGSVNLSRMVKATPGRETAQAGPAPEPSSTGAFPLRVNRVRVLGGKLNFADPGLVPQFATRIHDLDGAVVGISSGREDRARIELEGRVDEFGTAKIGGEINVAAPRAFTDVRMVFKNLEMANLTPYSAKFAGRRIESGKLNLTLAYTVENRQLTGDNQIVVDRLKLGGKVDHPEAINLPLDLAVALLEDSRGIIDIDLPVRGDLDNPEFSIGHLIWKALVNLLTKIVTSPFQALAGLVGAGAENPDAVLFEPGEAELPPPEREKLMMLVEALEKRPNLSLLVQGRYAPEVDGDSLKSRNVRRALAQRRGREIAINEDPGPVDFDDRNIQRALETMFVERYGEKQFQAFPEPLSTEKPAGAGRENVAPVAGDRALRYKSIFARLVESEPLSVAVLMRLAEKRAAAVVAELTVGGGLEPGRVGTRMPAALESGEPVSARLTLEASGE